MLCVSSIHKGANMNLAFNLEQAPIVFRIEALDAKSLAIHERAVRRGQTFLVSQAELLESIIEVDQNKTYEKFGLAYLTTYCVQYMGLDGDLAGVLVRIARKSQIVPELRRALANGDVSISNAKTIASVITLQNQEEWIEKAKTLTKAKLEREVATISPLKAKVEKARHIGNGRVQIVLNLSEEEYDRRCNIKDLVSQSLNKTATDSEVEVAMINCYEFFKDPLRKAERAAQRKCKDKDRSQDASSPSIEEDTIPAPVRHEVNLRDQRKCQARNADGRICGCSRWTHMHHIIPRAQGGKDVAENLITLCSAHHRLWHKRHDR
jgi:5-methylcytosine-specific restriction endonuclease McrA